MKKFFGILFAAALMAMPASAQVKFGIKGGLDISKLSISEDVVSSSNRCGFFVGPTVKFSLPIVGLGVDGSVLYEQKSSKVSNGVSEETIKQQQLAIPINVRYGVGLGDMANIFLFTGPQFAFNLGDKTTSLWSNVSQWTAKSSNFSWNVGLGVTVISHIQVTANYNIACGKTGEATVLNTAGKAFTGKSNTWQIGLAYFF